MKATWAIVLLAAVACGEKGANKNDSGLTRDLALASSVQQAQPKLQDTSVAPAVVEAPEPPRPDPTPVRTRARETPPPRPRPTAPARVAQQPTPQPQPAETRTTPTPAPAPGPAPVHREIGAGTGFSLTSGSRVCTNTNLPGDKLVATVSSTVTGTNGAIIPAGSTVVLEVASVTTGANEESAQITFRVRSIVMNDHTYDVDAQVAPATGLEKTKVAGQDPNADKKKVIGGAVAGAILGQIIGKNTKSTVIGAAAGAAAGAAVAKSGEKWEGCLPEGSPLRVTLNSPIVIS